MSRPGGSRKLKSGDDAPLAPTTSVRRALAFGCDESVKATKDIGRDSRSPPPKSTAKPRAPAAVSPQRRAVPGGSNLKAGELANGRGGRSKKERVSVLGSSGAETDDSEGTDPGPPVAIPRTPGRIAKGKEAAAASPAHTSVSAATKAHRTPVKEQPAGAEDDAEGALAANISPAKKAKITPPKAATSAAKKGFSTTNSPKSDVVCIPEVERVYSIVQKKTGAIGGNGAFGAIYGELTIGSMQRVVAAMKKFCELTADSAFIDVGSGLGKPNFHVAQDPGVSLSYGVELESIRYELAIHNLRAVLMEPAAGEPAAPKGTNRARKGPAAAAAAAGGGDAATATAAAEAPGTPRMGPDGQPVSQSPHKEKERKGRRQSAAPPAPVLRQHNVFFAQGDILDAASFNPFTHVYAFDVGFPPAVRQAMKLAFEKSSTARYLISYWRPKETIERLKYPVELLVQVPTSLMGSSEGHTAYLYRRNEPLGTVVGPDAMFAEGLALCSQAKGSDGGVAALVAHVEKKFRNFTEGGRRTRSRSRNQAAAADATTAAAVKAPAKTNEETTDTEARF